MSVFIIAEAGVNHNGQADLAFELVLQAKACGADAVKFQSFKAEKLVHPEAKTAEYQKNNTKQDDQLNMLKRLEMSHELHVELFDYCESIGIEFMSTPFDEESANFLMELGMKRIKVPSGEITNLPFLRYLASKKVPLIVSTGMSTMEEVQQAVDTISAHWESLGVEFNVSEYLTLLHCTSNYPADVSDINLNAMGTMHEVTKLNVGYSDHTLGVEVSIAAVAKGASVIEKHFTLDKSFEGPDHKASLGIDELENLCSAIRNVEMALGSADKKPTSSELPIRQVARRSLFTTRSLAEGEIVKEEDLCSLRPGDGISPAEIDNVVGKVIVKPLAPFERLTWDNVQ